MRGGRCSKAPVAVTNQTTLQQCCPTCGRFRTYLVDSEEEQETRYRRDADAVLHLVVRARVRVREDVQEDVAQQTAGGECLAE